MLPENLAKNNQFFQDNIPDLTDLIMAVLEIQVNPIIDPFQDENSIYSFCIGFLVSRKHTPTNELIEAVLIVKPFIQQMLDQFDENHSKQSSDDAV